MISLPTLGFVAIVAFVLLFGFLIGILYASIKSISEDAESDDFYPTEHNGREIPVGDTWMVQDWQSKMFSYEKIRIASEISAIPILSIPGLVVQDLETFNIVKFSPISGSDGATLLWNFGALMTMEHEKLVKLRDDLVNVSGYFHRRRKTERPSNV